MKDMGTELAKYNDIRNWKPKVGDILIWHGFFSHWFGVVNHFDGSAVSVIKQGLPKLLFCLDESEYNSNTQSIAIGRIRSSRGGEFSIIQDGIWFVDA